MNVPQAAAGAVHSERLAVFAPFGLARVGQKMFEKPDPGR